MSSISKIFLILVFVFSLYGCSDFNDWFDDNDTIDVTDDTFDDPVDGVSTGAVSGLSSPSYADYFGLTNGGRPTFYWYIDMSSFPSTFNLEITNCLSTSVTNNGIRWEGYGWILKQSDVAGRGMALVGTTCLATEAYVWW